MANQMKPVERIREFLDKITDGLMDNKNTKKLDLHITCTMYSEDNWKTQK